jgi:hypothetical protein
VTLNVSIYKTNLRWFTAELQNLSGRFIIYNSGLEIGTRSIYWVEQSRYLLPDNGDRLQSPKRRVFLIKNIRWIMSKKFVILTTHHRHKPSECNQTSVSPHEITRTET